MISLGSVGSLCIPSSAEKPSVLCEPSSARAKTNSGLSELLPAQIPAQIPAPSQLLGGELTLLQPRVHQEPADELCIFPTWEFIFTISCCNPLGRTNIVFIQHAPKAFICIPCCEEKELRRLWGSAGPVRAQLQPLESPWDKPGDTRGGTAGRGLRMQGQRPGWEG